MTMVLKSIISVSYESCAIETGCVGSIIDKNVNIIPTKERLALSHLIDLGDVSKPTVRIKN